MSLIRSLGDNSAAAARLGSVGDRLRRAAAAVPPNRLAVASTLPTVTTGTSRLDTTLTNSYRAATNGFQTYRLTGGSASTAASPFTTFPVVTNPANQGNTYQDSTHDTRHFCIEFMTDAPKVELEYLTTSVGYMIEVDNQPISATQMTAPGNGVWGYIALDFGGVSKTRKISFWLELNEAFAGVYVGPTYTIWAPISDTNIRVVHVGDSIATGTGSTISGGTWANVAQKLLGWTDLRQVAQGGTGFVNNAGNLNTFGSSQRVADAKAANPDLLLLSASGNDDSMSGITANALAAFQAYRAALPGVPIVVTGCFAASTGPSAARYATEDAVKAAFTQWGDPRSWWVPNSRDAAGSWEVGTGTTAATTGSGNRDRYGYDTAHPNQDGHTYLGNRFANAFRNTVLPNIP